LVTLVALLSQAPSARAEDLVFFAPVSSATVVAAPAVPRPMTITLVGYTDTEATAYAASVAASSRAVVATPGVAVAAAPVMLTLSDSLPVVKVWPAATTVAVAPMAVMPVAVTPMALAPAAIAPVTFTPVAFTTVAYR
jgi:hypothetical protein